MVNKCRALEVANLAYLKDKMGDEIIGIKEKNEKACIIISDDIIEIGVAGSNDFIDWRDNLRFIGTSTKNYGRIPKGFYVNVERLLPKVLFSINSDRIKPIRLSGHSRGAPIATLLSMALKLRGYNVVSVYGFGSPNIGKKSFVEKIKKLNIATFYFKNGGDQVTTVPKFGYKKPSSQIKIGPKRNWFTKIFNKDHYISRYIKNI